MAGRPLVRVVDDRRQETARRTAGAGDVTDVVGFVNITGTGEAIVDITFPVQFTEMPLFSPGCSLDDNETWTEGVVPTGSGFVLKWSFVASPATGARLYNGATVAFVTTGRDGQKSIGHYRFSGVALVGPAGR